MSNAAEKIEWFDECCSQELRLVQAAHTDAVRALRRAADVMHACGHAQHAEAYERDVKLIEARGYCHLRQLRGKAANDA